MIWLRTLVLGIKGVSTVSGNLSESHMTGKVNHIVRLDPPQPTDSVAGPPETLLLLRLLTGTLVDSLSRLSGTRRRELTIAGSLTSSRVGKAGLSHTAVFH